MMFQGVVKLILDHSFSE